MMRYLLKYGVLLCIMFSIYTAHGFGQPCNYPKAVLIKYKLASRKVKDTSDAVIEIEYQNRSTTSVYVFDELVDGYLYGVGSNFNIKLTKKNGLNYLPAVGVAYSTILPEKANSNDSIKMIMLKPGEIHRVHFNLLFNYVNQLTAGKYCLQLALMKIPADNKSPCEIQYDHSRKIYFEVEKTITDPMLKLPSN